MGNNAKDLFYQIILIAKLLIMGYNINFINFFFRVDVSNEYRYVLLSA